MENNNKFNLQKLQESINNVNQERFSGFFKFMVGIVVPFILGVIIYIILFNRPNNSNNFYK